MIYQADVYAENKVMQYYGSTERAFKKRCSEYKSSFRKVPKCHTTLSSHIWKLKDKGIHYEVKWSIKEGTCFLKWKSSMRPVPYRKTHNPNGRPKHNIEQKRRIARNLQTSKKKTFLYPYLRKRKITLLILLTKQQGGPK